ncbi:uncharacterized protein LOC133201270 [Saccostrea echinata]|uniref:uncharacterized protein LOC133201270 n=1 Tax=Saccostrea echinata TaxID=191078 RepID=UPI002A8159D4|nr:uncharacterized protein LOC133201270 [Saccostrea echinata]
MTYFSVWVILVSVCLSLVVIYAQDNISRSIPTRPVGKETRESNGINNLAGQATSKSLQQRESNRISFTTPRVVFPDRLILREKDENGWRTKDRVAAILCWYCTRTWSPQYCITICQRHWLR